MRPRTSIGLWLAIVWSTLGFVGAEGAGGESTTVSLSTGIVTRQVAVREGRLATKSIVSLSGPDSVSLPIDSGRSAEFVLTLLDGSTLTADDYRVVGRTGSEADGAHLERFRLSPIDARHPRVTVEYRARAGDHFLRKRLLVEGSETVDSIAVESLAVSGSSDLGGFGQPLFLADRWFTGLEYPGGWNEARGGRLALRHFPGRANFTSKWAVVGAASFPREPVEEAFERYLDTIRRPPRSSLQYNGWYDRRGGEITPESMRATFETFRERLLEPFDLRFDAFVIDDGYQEPNSVWGCGKRWPDGFAPFATFLESHGSRLGLWLPLNGYGLNTAWGAESGFERSDHRKRYYCLAGPHYDAALREAIRVRIRDGNLAYLKHDFNFLECGSEGHGHLATARHGREANLDAQLALLEHERALQPEIFLNVTSNIWPSPWWLAWADTIWMGSADYAHDRREPQWSDREAEMTFRDERLHHLLRIERARTPAAALMTHGIIRGRYEGIDATETRREWADYVTLYFGRGTLLHELYVSPDRMPDEHWEVLGNAIRWARANVETLRHTRMIGGRPARGSAYGYVHWSRNKGIVCLRNPSSLPCRFELSLEERPVHFPVVEQWDPIVVYPERRLLPPISATGRRSVDLPAASVTLIELHAERPEFFRAAPIGAFDLIENGGLAKLVGYGARTPSEVHATAPIDQQKKRVTGTFALGKVPRFAEADLTIVRTPSAGASVDVVCAAAGSIERRVAAKPADWDMSRRPLDLAQSSELTIDCRLPPSPFWPEEAEVSALLRVRAELPVTWERTLPSDARLPDWPSAPDSGTVLDETVLLDGELLARRRSTAESVVWALLLGLAPVVFATWLARRMTANRPWWARGLVSTGILASLVALYALTPLATALARALR